MGGFLIVFLGAGLGGMARHGVNVLALRLLGSAFPFGTLAVNVLGSLVMGLLVGWFAHRGDPGLPWRLFLTTGILGGFTTFSTYSVDVTQLVRAGAPGTGLVYLFGTLAAALVAVEAGMAMTRWATRARPAGKDSP